MLDDPAGSFPGAQTGLCACTETATRTRLSACAGTATRTRVRQNGDENVPEHVH